MSVVFPEMVHGEDLTVSATGYLAWRRCPDRGLARFRGIYDAATPATFRGILAHRVFARHLRDGPIPDAELRQVCREEIGKSLNPSLVELGLKPSRVDGVVEEVRALYGSFVRLPAESVTEVEIHCEDEPAEGVRLKGVIDAVFAERDGGVRLTDWKTGSLGAAGAQLAFYALLWTLTRGEMPVRVEAISVSSGERIEARPDTDSLAATASELASMVDAVRTAMADGRHLKRVAGPWCRSCPLLDTCDEGAAAISLLSS